ncbi:hypothetical protein MAR_023246 [Mya arenaria]|uniref:Mitochondria-eating protein C-terminal domain-containing protein n=1 Tax=Mya arenaria TaxID=6604 RepID=A0ABY7DPS3_MYAAR|nr:hypothetical protein MAR_023246 [Mya arenaria]
MGQQGTKEYQPVGVTVPEGVREPSPKGVPFPELLNRVEKEANRMLSTISSMRKAKPYGSQTVDLFREECLSAKRKLHNMHYEPALIQVPKVEHRAHPAKSDQAKDRPSPEQQHEQKENNDQKRKTTNIHEFCETKADSILTQTEEAVNCLFKKYKMLTEKKSREIRRSLRKLMQEYLLQSKWKPKTPAAAECKKEPTNDVKIQPIHVTDRMKKLLKEMSESMVPVVQMAFIEASWDSGCVEDLKPFIMKCIYVCWMMVVQNPLMCFFLPKPGTDVNTSMFKVYTKSGRTVDFIVWPAMMLHETGSVVCKGVLQPK